MVAKKVYTTEELEKMRAVDTTARVITAHMKVLFKCHLCEVTGEKAISEANKTLKKLGFAFQCKECFNNKIKARSPEWLANVRAAAQNPEHKERARKNGVDKKKYFEKDIIEVLNKSGVTYIGDLSNPGNTIKVYWPDGVSRSMRIRRFMVDGFIDRPKTKKESFWHQKHLGDVEKLGITVEMIGEKRAKITYKGQSWDQHWVNHIDAKCLRKIKNINNGIEMERLLSSGVPLNKACKIVGVDPNRYYRNKRSGISAMDTAVSTKNFLKLIEIEGAVYDKRLGDTAYRPDILLEYNKLIIETDGMRYHSEEMKDKDYHATKWNVFNELGYKFLAFSEYEVKEKRPIVDSMIQHRLGESERIQARKCLLREVPSNESNEFFERCHMKGRGQGTTLGLYYKDVLVCALRYHDDGDKINISRFVCELGKSVTGGYSRLLSKLPEDKDIVNFVDRRHGTGEHLLSKGFVLTNVHIGFEWTDNYYHWNRRKHLGDSGYDLGLKKFWDYGQAKYVKPKKATI